ncbi:Toxin [Caenorhabditis elegans]|uniref:Toxin n=1 Tax=Caenorhabditis elegans TaxID=6239 RepID=Q9BKX4_CAEEL|nr:Toxin [Caenorhabditis elegans]CCD73765.1 Toxin [Caenorhabditis elegans]|eukprot:NP_497447.1 Uncharacterized protein CELE_Y22D7AR.10 [Caenorhabditis elegans]
MRFIIFLSLLLLLTCFKLGQTDTCDSYGCFPKSISGSRCCPDGWEFGGRAPCPANPNMDEVWCCPMIHS